MRNFYSSRQYLINAVNLMRRRDRYEPFNNYYLLKEYNTWAPACMVPRSNILLQKFQARKLFATNEFENFWVLRFFELCTCYSVKIWNYNVMLFQRKMSLTDYVISVAKLHFKRGSRGVKADAMDSNSERRTGFMFRIGGTIHA